MPRNPSGDYSLPAGNPVTTGTVISSAVQNSTMTDIATALTDSLSRSGKGGMLAPFQLADGASVAPSLAFTTEPTTGIYHPGVSTYAVVVQGTPGFQVNGPNASPANVLLAQLPLKQVITGTPYDVANVKADTTILGNWTFTYDAVNFRAPMVSTYGGMLFNELAANKSGIVRIVTVAPSAGAGKPGDLWLVV